MKYEIYREFLNKKVCIGLPNWFDPDKVFFQSGTILEITDDYLMLKTVGGIHKINLDEIIQIELFREGA